MLVHGNVNRDQLDYFEAFYLCLLVVLVLVVLSLVRMNTCVNDCKSIEGRGLLCKGSIIKQMLNTFKLFVDKGRTFQNSYILVYEVINNGYLSITV